MGPASFDYNMRLIQLSVIQLSGGHCTADHCGGKGSVQCHVMIQRGGRGLSKYHVTFFKNIQFIMFYFGLLFGRKNSN